MHILYQSLLSHGECFGDLAGRPRFRHRFDEVNSGKIERRMELLLSITLFVVFGIAFVFLNLTLGALARPKAPNSEKLAVYECGEPAVGIGWVQFDLRFYIVGLVFLVFDVEVALLYPWAVTYGSASNRRMPKRPSRSGKLPLSTCCFSSVCCWSGFAYLWRFGYLDWVRGRKESPRS